MKVRISAALILSGLLLGGLTFGVARMAAADEAGPDAAVTFDASACAGCHDDQIAKLKRGPHGAAAADDPHAGLEALSCTTCHGDPTAHLDEGGEGPIFAFGEDELPTVKANRCLSCHGDTHPRFFATGHAAAGLDCASCHTIHGEGKAGRALLKTGGPLAGDPHTGVVSASCSECHGDVFAQFGFNERHRLQENILDCASCHDPHEPQSRLLLGGFKQQQCVQCHADKAGPYIFEHGSQRVEGCIACHDPHGSPNRHLLTFQNVADVCYTCHGVVPGFHLSFTADTQCTNCHSSIHGSNFDPFFLK